MNPFQGLKLRPQAKQSSTNGRHKRHESLSGIETYRKKQLGDRPSRHKRHESLSGIETMLTATISKLQQVTNDMNPFQGLKLLERILMG